MLRVTVDAGIIYRISARFREGKYIPVSFEEGIDIEAVGPHRETRPPGTGWVRPRWTGASFEARCA